MQLGNILHFILNPNRAVLLMFSGLSLLSIILFNFYYSFKSQYVFGIREYMIGLLILLMIGAFLSKKIDSKFKTQISIYFKISIVQLVIVWVISNPVKNWQIESSKVKSQKIIDVLEEYQTSFGTYPEALSDIKTDIPVRTNIGTRYCYKKLSDNNYNLQFASYYGYWLEYEQKNPEWSYLDD